MKRSFLSFIKPRNEYEDIINILVDILEKYLNEDQSDKITFLENENKTLKNEKNELFSVIIKTRDGDHEESFVCKSSDKFNILENKFYELHPEYKDQYNKFMIGINIIDKEKTLEENKIGKNIKIIIEENE